MKKQFTSNAPNCERLRAYCQNLPEKIEEENIDPQVLWLYNYKLNFRLRRAFSSIKGQINRACYIAVCERSFLMDFLGHGVFAYEYSTEIDLN